MLEDRNTRGNAFGLAFNLCKFVANKKDFSKDDIGRSFVLCQPARRDLKGLFTESQE